MDKIINRLFQIEQNADDSLTELQKEKQALRQRYDAKKEAFRNQAQDRYDKRVDNFKQQFEADRAKKIQATQTRYNNEMQRIQQLVDHEQEEYVSRFLNRTKSLGVMDK